MEILIAADSKRVLWPLGLGVLFKAALIALSPLGPTGSITVVSPTAAGQNINNSSSLGQMW